MAAAWDREIAALRRDLERNQEDERGTDSQAICAGRVNSSVCRGMIERMEKTWRTDRGVARCLRREIDEIKGRARSSGPLRETSAPGRWASAGRPRQAVGTRWPAACAASARATPRRKRLEERLTRIESAVHALPEALSLRTLEDKMRTLAGVVETLSSTCGTTTGFGIEAIESIERRLDELSRAIVSSTSAQRTAYFDPEPLEADRGADQARWHARSRNMQVESGFGHLSPNRDDLHPCGRPRPTDGLPSRTPSNELAEQIAIISDKLDTVPSIPDMAPIFRDLETPIRPPFRCAWNERHDDALEQGQKASFRELEQRLEQMASRQAEWAPPPTIPPDPKGHARSRRNDGPTLRGDFRTRLEKTASKAWMVPLSATSRNASTTSRTRLESTARATAKASIPR